MPEKLTQERLKKILHYDPEIGVFKWVVSRGRRAKGMVAGCINRSGYRYIMVGGRNYKASRLAWLFIKGYFPENDVDHINRVRNDDKWSNLRHVSRQCNNRNCGIKSNNTSGVCGVSRNKLNEKWYARIFIAGKSLHLGFFKSKTDAVKARWEAEKKHNWPSCCTTSTAYLYLKGINND